MAIALNPGTYTTLQRDMADTRIIIDTVNKTFSIYTLGIIVVPSTPYTETIPGQLDLGIFGKIAVITSISFKLTANAKVTSFVFSNNNTVFILPPSPSPFTGPSLSPVPPSPCPCPSPVPPSPSPSPVPPSPCPCPSPVPPRPSPSPFDDTSLSPVPPSPSPSPSPFDDTSLSPVPPRPSPVPPRPSPSPFDGTSLSPVPPSPSPVPPSLENGTYSIQDKEVSNESSEIIFNNPVMTFVVFSKNSTTIGRKNTLVQSQNVKITNNVISMADNTPRGVINSPKSLTMNSVLFRKTSDSVMIPSLDMT